MTAHNEQIVTAFEINGMMPEQIAEAFSLDPMAVKAILMQHSTLYRKDAKNETALQFTEGEAEEMKGIILNIARYCEDDPNLQFKAAKFILEDKKGRLDIISKMPQFNFNVLNFSEQMKKALEARERTEKKAEIVIECDTGDLKQLQPA